jgi:aldehyde dehydrogenase
VLNVVNGPGAEIGKALAPNKRIAKIGLTGETVTGRLIMSYAAQNLIPSTTGWVASRRTSSSRM